MRRIEVVEGVEGKEIEGVIDLAPPTRAERLIESGLMGGEMTGEMIWLRHVLTYLRC